MASKKTTDSPVPTGPRPDEREASRVASKAPVRSAAGSELDEPQAPGGHHFRAIRETVESIVVAFVLAFLFRTFEAEAFVIPTGSMSPSLLGQHKDADCPQCGHRFRVSASSEETDGVQQMRQRLKAGKVRERLPNGAFVWRKMSLQQRERLREQIHSQDIVGGMCPMCRYLTPFRKDLPSPALESVDVDAIDELRSYPGDRILVNKYGFAFHSPERWDVVVFKFPGNGNMNYIKRLVGLPNETLRLYQGDVFARPLEDEALDFEILRKPPAKVDAMLQLVHDNAFEPTMLYNAGWPLRWAPTASDGWNEQIDATGRAVKQSFHIEQDVQADATAWIRYRHLIPESDDWEIARLVDDMGSFASVEKAEGISQADWQASIRPSLIRDFNPYNARLQRNYAERDGWQIIPASGPGAGSLGTEWVGDLALEAQVQIEQAEGELVLEVVEAGYHFQAVINLTNGIATFGIVDGRTREKVDFEAQGQTPLSSPGVYRLRLANVDDRLLLWVDGKLIEGVDAAYDPDRLLGGREGLIPWASQDDQGDQGDLSPAGVGVRGKARLAVQRLAVFRDIYYIATKYNTKVADPEHDAEHGADYPVPPRRELADLFSQPELWSLFRQRHARTFPIESDQFFVMGDNSPESQDCRLWLMSGHEGPNGSFAGQPGGAYLDRRLLIGEAVCVFWPHSWGGIPGVPQLPGWPNFGDMRLVR